MHRSLERTIDYVEMPTRDVVATRRFFEQLLGWKFEDYGPDYIAFDDGRTTGGFKAADRVVSTEEGAALVVFYHSDLPAMVDQVLKLGGTITREIFEFPGGQRFQFVAPGAGEFAFWSEK